MGDFYIVSLKHTMRSDRYITVWRPDDAGYAYPLSWAGKYHEDSVLNNLSYYNNGDTTIAVPCETLDRIAADPEPKTIDNDAGPVILNKTSSWRQILDNAIRPTPNSAKPNCKGWARRHQETK